MAITTDAERQSISEKKCSVKKKTFAGDVMAPYVQPN